MLRSKASRFLRTAALLSFCVGSTAEAQTSAGEDKSAVCVEGFEQSQVLRQSGKLRAARLELLKCAQLHCQQALQVPCTRWLEEVETATPTVIIEATVDGEDRSEVRVEMDGELLTEQLTGTAIEVDPGPHTFRFLHAEFPPVEKKFLIREGDKRRAIPVAFAHEDAAPKAAEEPVASQTPVAPPEKHRPVPVITYVLTGAAVVGVGAFAFMALTAEDRKRELEDTCSPGCSDEEVDSLKSRYLMANVSLGIGAAAGIGAIVAYLTRPTVQKAESALTATVNVTPYSASAAARFRF